MNVKRLASTNGRIAVNLYAAKKLEADGRELLVHLSPMANSANTTNDP